VSRDAKKRLASNCSSAINYARMSKVPTFDELMNPALRALRDLGGQASINQVYERVIHDLELPNDALSELQNPDVNNQTKVHYRLGWALTYLKKYGVIATSGRGVWSLTKAEITSVDPTKVKRTVHDLYRGKSEIRTTNIDFKELEHCYRSDATVKVLCDHMAKRERNQRETKMERILALLKADGNDVRMRDLSAAFRRLGEIGCGKRRRFPSRFVWSEVGFKACRDVSATTPTVQPPQPPLDCKTKRVLQTHTFNLRADLPITFVLPINLTSGEAERLATFIKTLPL